MMIKSQLDYISENRSKQTCNGIQGNCSILEKTLNVKELPVYKPR